MGMQMAAMQGQAQGALEHEHGGRYHMKQQAGRISARYSVKPG